MFHQNPNFPPVHGYDPKSQFNNHNFANPNTSLHNNLHDIILHEEIREYSVMIDSKDRNYQVYQDPFCYDVIFNPLPKSYDGKNTVFEEPNPTIYQKFTNIRYIKLEEIILPMYNRVKTTTDYNEAGDVIDKRWVVDTLRPITDNMYLVLSLGDNFTDTNYRSTNDVLSNNFSLIYFDSKMNNTHYYGFTSNGLKTFPQDQLGRLDRLRISFRNPYGEKITCSHVDPSIMSDMKCRCLKPEGDDDTDCFKHNLFHPLNPIFQHHIHLKIGVVEPKLNKKHFY